MTFSPVLPLWGIVGVALLALAAAGTAFRRKPAILSPGRHRLLLALRAVVWCSLLILLLNPGRVREEPHRDRSHLVFLLDRSASMGTRDLPYGRSRWEQELDFIRKIPKDEISDYPIHFYTFSQSARETDLSVADAVRPAGETDLREAVRTVDRDIGLDRVAGLVLCSDGIDTSSFKGNEWTVPLFCVPIGSDLSQAKDLSIEPLKPPAKIGVHETLSLEVPLLMRGYPRPRTVRFRAMVDGKPLLQSSPLLTSGRIRRERVTFTPGKPGLYLLSMECGALEGEVSTLNNRQEFALEVVEDEKSVVAYFPLLNRSFRPLLREFLREDSPPFTGACRISPQQVLLHGKKPDTRFARGIPGKASDLKRVNTLIIGAHAEERITASEAFVLEQYVRDGGFLIFLAGGESFGSIPKTSPLRRLLPVIPPGRPTLLPGPFSVAVDDEADGAVASRIGDLIAENAGDDSFTLPVLNAVDGVKASAKVQLWAGAGKRYPLAVTQRYGRGQVLALLSNGIHQWGRAERRERNFSLFWRTWIAFSGRSDEEGELLSVSLEKEGFAEGEPLLVKARALLPEGMPTNATLSVTAECFSLGEEKPFNRVNLESRGLFYRAELPGMGTGRYLLRVTSSAGETLIRRRYRLLAVGQELRESRELRVLKERFDRYTSPDRLFRVSDQEALATALSEGVRRGAVIREEPLIYEYPALFVLLVALILTELLLRRFSNLF